jgi:hypothetical protein
MTTQVNKQSLGASDILMLYWFLLQLLSYLDMALSKNYAFDYCNVSSKITWMVCMLPRDRNLFLLHFFPKHGTTYGLA